MVVENRRYPRFKSVALTAEIETVRAIPNPTLRLFKTAFLDRVFGIEPTAIAANEPHQA